MRDSDFKQLKFIMPDRWQVNSRGCVIDDNRYAPDVSIKNENNEVLCVIESSSTNDRKVGLGELLLAHKYFIDKRIKGIIIYSLCGLSDISPTPDTQYRYIQPYFEYFKSLSNEFGVKKVFIIKEQKFNDLNWDISRIINTYEEGIIYLD